MRMTLIVEWQDRPSTINDFCRERTEEAFTEFNRPEESRKDAELTKHQSYECYSNGTVGSP